MPDAERQQVPAVTTAPDQLTAGARMNLPATAVRLRAALTVPAALYLFALIVGLAAAATVIFPTNEGSAYYVSVARNIAAGRGPVIDAIWSYATPPLILPRPAFELWQPMASFIAAVPMLLLGGTFAAAQLGAVILGAAVAPLTWAITRDAAATVGTPALRVDHLAIGAGVVAALFAPFVLAVAVPDSTLPFLVFGTLACWLAPRALAGARWSGLLLGVALGLAYLSRHEAVYIGAVVLAVALAPPGRIGANLRRLVPVVVGGALIVVPWLIRDMAVFGTPLPGQAIDNAFLTSNDEIFNYGARPTLDGFLDQGGRRILANVLSGSTHNVVDVLLVPTVPVGLVGLLGVFVFARDRRARDASSFWLLIAAGSLTLVIDSVAFPVATAWGTFLHASGPLHVGLLVASVLVADRVVDAVRQRRHWKRANAWLAPLALALVALPMTAFQLLALGGGRGTEQSYAALAAAVRQQPEFAATVGGRVITDHPIWLAYAGGIQTLALPVQPVETVLRLSRDFNAGLVVVAETRGQYPQAFRVGPQAACFVERPLPPGTPAGAAMFAIAETCR